MIYLAIKAVHVLAAALLLSGILLIAFALRLASQGAGDPHTSGFVAAVRRWDQRVTTPALGAVWLAGFAMAFGAGWYTSLWLMVKIIPVVFLTGLHGMASAALKRVGPDGIPLAPLLRHAPAATIFAFALIALLAVMKPF